MKRFLFSIGTALLGLTLAGTAEAQGHGRKPAGHGGHGYKPAGPRHAPAYKPHHGAAGYRKPVVKPYGGGYAAKAYAAKRPGYAPKPAAYAPRPAAYAARGYSVRAAAYGAKGYVARGYGAGYRGVAPVRFKYGYYFSGRYGHRWSKRYYSPIYRAWFYYSPVTFGWYYWYGPRTVYYPVTYIPYAAPTVVATPVPPGEIPSVGEEEAPSLPPPGSAELPPGEGPPEEGPPPPGIEE
jgi:hypothetical protein